jgi:hypothetical protein
MLGSAISPPSVESVHDSPWWSKRIVALIKILAPEKPPNRISQLARAQVRRESLLFDRPARKPCGRQVRFGKAASIG